MRNIALRPINFCFVQIGAGGRPQPHRCRCWHVAERRIRAARTPTGLERTCIQSVDFDPVPTCGSWELLLRKMCHHSPRAGHWGLWPPPGDAMKTAAAGFKPTAVIKMTLSWVAKHQADAGLLRGSRWRGLPLRHRRFLRLFGHSQLPFRLRTEVGRRQDFSEGVFLLFGVLRVGSCHKHMNQWLIEAMFKVRCR